MVGSSSTTKMRLAIRSARSPQFLDVARLQEDEVLGQVGDPVGDAFQVVGDEHQVGGRVDVGAVGDHALHQVVEDAVVDAVDAVILGSNDAGRVDVAGHQ